MYASIHSFTLHHGPKTTALALLSRKVSDIVAQRWFLYIALHGFLQPHVPESHMLIPFHNKQATIRPPQTTKTKTNSIT